MPRGPQVEATGVGVLFHGPVSVVHLLVAVVAYQYEVVGLGGASVLPFHDVVRHTPFGFLAAADASAVSGFKGRSQGEVGVAAG